MPRGSHQKACTVEGRGGVRGHWEGEPWHAALTPVREGEERSVALQRLMGRAHVPVAVAGVGAEALLPLPPLGGRIALAPLYLPIGLTNPRNICFVNAGLQATLALPFVAHYFGTGAYLRDLHTATPSSLLPLRRQGSPPPAIAP